MQECFSMISNLYHANNVRMCMQAFYYSIMLFDRDHVLGLPQDWWWQPHLTHWGITYLLWRCELVWQIIQSSFVCVLCYLILAFACACCGLNGYAHCVGVFHHLPCGVTSSAHNMMTGQQDMQVTMTGSKPYLEILFSVLKRVNSSDFAKWSGRAKLGDAPNHDSNKT